MPRQIIAVQSRSRPSGGIYFSPGAPPGAGSGGELYRYRKGSAPVLVWTAPAYASITALAWASAGALYAWVAAYDGDWNLWNYVYRVPLAVGTPEQVAGPYQYNTPDFGMGRGFATDVAEYLGDLYVSHGGDSPQYATRFSPSSNANVILGTVPYIDLGQPYGVDPVHYGFMPDEHEWLNAWAAGGIAVAGNAVYWCSGSYLFRSIGAGFGLAQDLTGLSGWTTGGGCMVTNPVDGCVYFGMVGGVAVAGVWDWTGLMVKVDANGWASVDSTGLASSGGDAAHASAATYSCGMGYDGLGSSLGVFAQAGGAGAASAVFRRGAGGGWAQEGTAGSRGGLGQAFASDGGEVLALCQMEGSPGSALLRRDVSGTWGTVQTWPNYTTAGHYSQYAMAVARPAGSRLCHEI